MNEKQEMSPIEQRVLYGFGVFTGLGLVIVLYVLADWRKTFIAILWALACLAVGHLIGFIFGIPRVTKPALSMTAANSVPDSNNAATSSSSDLMPYQVNTNLQDISDWLTKIIVGLGLVELSKSYSHLQTAAQFISSGLGGPETTALSGGIIVYFSTVGFLGGYTTTRLFLGAAFVRADRALNAADKREVENAVINVEDLDGSLTPRTKAIAEKIAGIPWKSIKVAEVPIWAKAKLIVREIHEAVDAYKYLVRANPTDIVFRLNLSQALFESGDREGALQQAKDALALVNDSTPKDLVDTCYKALMYFPLYMQPDGYKQTIECANLFQALPGKQMTAPMWVNLAAAYGQQAATDKAMFASAKIEALNASKKAIAIDPKWKEKLREMWRPAPNAEDNDLEIFKDDDEFKTLLN